MSKTIRKVAEQLNVSKTAIRQHINAIPEFKNKYVKIEGNRFIIDDNGVSILKSNFAKLSRSSQCKNDKSSRSKFSKKQNNKDIDHLIAVLSEQLAIKDQQLKERTQEIKELHTLLENSQKLQLIKDKEVKQLQEKLQLLECSKTQSTSRSSQNETLNKDNMEQNDNDTESHKRWWQFWK